MKENQFVVDLGDMRLTDAQRKRINVAVQSAVTGVLAETDISKRAVLLPINKLPRGPIIYGLIIRDWKQFGIDNVKEIFG